MTITTYTDREIALKAQLAAMTAERDTLCQQLAEAQALKDAERYRWLTVNAYVGIAPHPKPHEVWCLRLPNPSGCNSIDAAIDAAMQGGAA